jgi:hypothetical protein
MEAAIGVEADRPSSLAYDDERRGRRIVWVAGEDADPTDPGLRFTPGRVKDFDEGEFLKFPVEMVFETLGCSSSLFDLCWTFAARRVLWTGVGIAG